MVEKTCAVRWHRRAESRSEEILQAAIDVLWEKGFRATRLDDVAAKAGVTKPLIYHYFEGKDDLVHKAMEWKLSHVISDMRFERDGSGAQWEDRLRAVCTWQWQRWCSPEWGRLQHVVLSEMRQEAPDLYRKWILQTFDRRNKVVEEILRDAHSDLRSGIDPESSARFLIAGLRQLAQVHACGGDLAEKQAKLDAMLETSLDVFIHGIRKPMEAG